MKLWGGRFEKKTDRLVDDFHSSITFDKRLYHQDIATFGDSGEMYSHKDSAGFINLYGLPLKVQAMMKQKAGIKE